MTYDDIVEAALARTLDWDGEFPSSRLPMFRRIGKRQQQLFSQASKLNPDYYGRCATGDIDANGCLDLRLLETAVDLDQSAGVQRVEVNDEGTSVTVVAGQEVTGVSIADQDADEAPRYTLRDRIIRGVGADLDGVVSLDVYYPRISDMPLVAEDGTTDVELHDQHQELLIIDLTKDLVRKTMNMEVAVKAAIQGILDAEEAGALENYIEDIRAFAIGQRHRFSEPAPTSTR